MSDDAKTPVFTPGLEQAFKKMAEASRTVVSCTYEVHRSNGELFVQRSQGTDSTAEPQPAQKAA